MNNNSFEYSGHLVFSFYEVQFKQEKSIHSDYVAELLERLPEYSEGSPEEPGEGYVKISPLQHAYSESELHPQLLEKFEAWTCIQYCWEDFTEVEAYVNGDKHPVQIPNVESVDLFLHSSGLTLLRGKSSAIHQATSRLQKITAGDFLFDHLKLESSNIYNLASETQHSNQTPKLRLRHSKLAEFSSVDISTDKVVIRGSGVESSEVGEIVRRDGRIVRLWGEFELMGLLLSADVRRDKIFVRINGDLENLSSASRFVVSILFCEIVLGEQLDIQQGDLQ